MKAPRISVAILAWAVVAGCDVQATNRAPVFTPVAGAVAVTLRIPVVPDSTAHFSLDGRTLDPDLNAEDGYSVVLDTTGFADGLHTLEVRIVDKDKQVLQTLRHSVLIRNMPEVR